MIQIHQTQLDTNTDNTIITKPINTLKTRGKKGIQQNNQFTTNQFKDKNTYVLYVRTNKQTPITHSIPFHSISNQISTSQFQWTKFQFNFCNSFAFALTDTAN